MVERSECSIWSNAYFVSFDHKEQFARIDNFLVNKKLNKYIHACDFYCSQ